MYAQMQMKYVPVAMYRSDFRPTNLDTLELWRLRADLIVCYKIVFGKLILITLVLHLPITRAVMDTNYLLDSLLVTYDITFSVVVLLAYGIICRIILLTFLVWGNSSVVAKSWSVEVLIVLYLLG